MYIQSTGGGMGEVPIIPPDNYSGSVLWEHRPDPVGKKEKQATTVQDISISEPSKEGARAQAGQTEAPKPTAWGEAEKPHTDERIEEEPREALPTGAFGPLQNGLFSRFPILSGLLPPRRAGAGSSISEIALIVLLLLALSGEGEGGKDLLGNDTLPFLLLLLFWN